VLTAEQAWRLLLTPAQSLGRLADEWDSVLRETLAEPRRDPPYFWLGADAERA